MTPIIRAVLEKARYTLQLVLRGKAQSGLDEYILLQARHSVAAIDAVLGEQLPAPESLREVARRHGFEPTLPLTHQDEIDSLTGKRMGPESQAEPLAGADARTFEYLLNRVERTGCSTAPADAGYGEARKAVFAYVATEREARRKAEAKLAAAEADAEEAITRLVHMASEAHRILLQCPDNYHDAHDHFAWRKCSASCCVRAREAEAAHRTRIGGGNE